MKKCSKCGIEKELTEFGKYKRSKDGLKPHCKICRREESKKYRESNKDKIKKQAKKYRESNKDKIKESQKEWRENNIEKVRERCREYYQNNKEERKEYDKEYYQNNKEKVNKRKKEYREKNKEHFKEYHKEYREKNIERINEYVQNNKEIIKERQRKWREKNKESINKKSREYIKERRKNDTLFKLKCGVRALIGVSIRNNGYTKKSKTHKILGCSFEEFKKHLESQFKDWMSWSNQGLYNGEFNYGWDIDHIIPLSSATTEEELIKLNHYTNLQPLCSHINRDIKRDNILPEYVWDKIKVIEWTE